MKKKLTPASGDYLKAWMLCFPPFPVEYLKELGIKVEHQSDHATFLNWM